MTAIGMPAARPGASASWLPIYVLLFVGLSVAKAPAVLIDTRFWAEEATVFYTQIRALPLLDALSFVFLGSLYLIPNVTVYAATKVPLLYAPAITTYTAFMIEALTAVLIYRFVIAYRVNVLAGLLLVAAWVFLPQTYETSATITNAQWTCAVSMLLVMALPGDMIQRNIVKSAAWTLLCGLTGVASCMLAPGFMVRAYIERSWSLAALGLILGACSFVQLALLWSFGTSGRTFITDPLILTLPTLLQTVISPSIGLAAAERLITPIREGVASECRLLVLYVVAGSIVALSIVLAMRSGHRALAVIIAGQGALVSLLNTFGALGNPKALLSAYGGGRYYLFAAMCFCILLTLGTAAKATSRYVAIAMLAVVAIGSAVDGLRTNWKTSGVRGPPWKAEVAKCKELPCRLAIWPFSWTLVLK